MPSNSLSKNSSPNIKRGGQGYEEALVSDTLNAYDLGESRTPIIVVEVYDEDNMYRQRTTA